MSIKVSELIEYSSESESLDFKREQYKLQNYKKKNELLKDISAMANHPNDDDKFIVVGVYEKDGRAVSFSNIDKLVDDAKYQQFVNSNIEPQINFDYKSYNYEGFQLAYFRIYNNRSRPYLFKKDVRDPIDRTKIEYRAGDGYIRKGSSTKKITRVDFELIYKNRFEKPDRKSDIIITPYFGTPDDDEYSELPIKYLDIFISNKSNQSIDLDVEMKVYKSDKFQIILEENLIAIQTEAYRKNNPRIIIQPAVFHNFHIDYKDFSEYIKISRSKMRYEKTALAIQQNDTEKDIFYQYLLVYTEEPGKVDVEITLRSDEFTEGPLVEKHSVKIDYINT